ncbi:hypothetical protein V499_01396 [Pseudogymnoascus sp. VKM F-103]|nr:hypothetical protein V499_01396 [Pseudogymnoascus sp. VKM F-103]
MEPELQQWICGTVIVEAKKLLRDSTHNSFQDTTKGHDNAMQVHLSGTRAVQIIDFNGQRKAPFTNISVSDVSCQIRASLSEAARKQFENSLVLKGGEGSSNRGFPVPIEEIEDVRQLMTRMKNTVPPQEALVRSRYKCTSPIGSLAEIPSGDEMGSPNGQLATQAPVAPEIYDKHSKATKKSAPSSRNLKAVNLPGNQLLGLIGKNKKSNTPSSNLMGGIPESRRPISLSNNKRAAAIEGGAGKSNERKFLRLTGSGNGAIRMPVGENKGSGKPIVHSKQGVPGENPRVGSQSTNDRGSNAGTPLVDPLRLTTSQSEKELPRPIRDMGLNSRPTNKPTFNSFQENPWGKLNRIPLKHVIIPKRQLVKLSTAASWVTSVADIESLHISLQSDIPDSFMPSTPEHVVGTVDQIITTPGHIFEAKESGTNKRSLSDGSSREVEVSSPRNNYHESQRAENLSDNIRRHTTCQKDPVVILDAVGAEEDDAVSWAPTSRASSMGPIPENENEPLIISAFPPPHSNTHSLQATNQVPAPSSPDSSPSRRLNMDSNVHLSSILPSLSDSSDIKFDNGTDLKDGGGSLTNNVHSSIPHSEDDMEQRVPYAIGDVIQSSDDIYLSRIPASAITVSSTRSQQSPVLQIERTPYSRSQKDQPSLPEARFLGSPLEPKKPMPSPHSSAGSIILGTFNWDASKDDDTPGHFSTHDKLQQGHDKDRRASDVTLEPSAGEVAGQSECLSTPVLDHPPISIDAGGERELCGENRNGSGFNQNEVTFRYSSQPKSTQDVKSSVSIDVEKLSEPAKPLGSESPVYNVLPSLPSITSPTSKKIAKSYITRRERKRQREESGMQFL